MKILLSKPEKILYILTFGTTSSALNGVVVCFGISAIRLMFVPVVICTGCN